MTTPTATTGAGAKPRYELLDGLRGVAAVLVVCFHIAECYSMNPVDKLLNHGYLAVDFFFVLSGFVIGYAYDDRWRSGRMTAGTFFKRRLVRLQPLVFLGVLLGVGLFYFSDCPAFPKVSSTTVWMLLGSALLSAFLIPQPPSLNVRGTEELSSVNIPAWSLFFEYVGNLLYALFLHRLSRRALAVATAVAAVFLLDAALTLNVFGWWNRTTFPLSLNAGFFLYPEHVYIGMARLCYPFFAGLLLSRLRHRLPSARGGFWWCALLIAVALTLPCMGGWERPWMDGAYNAFCTLFLFPFVVALGAGSRIRGRHSTRVCRFLGDISYPLYITHYPMIYVLWSWIENHPDASWSVHAVVVTAVFVLNVCLAYAALRLYDEPVRAWLQKHWLRPGGATGNKKRSRRQERPAAD